ncbi:MAG: HAD-IIIA family hydrolase, partial [Proteobacteria bacterium]|nr:HAD-IIIA family hydrolase [Pseudomonadota bacterium]
HDQLKPGLLKLQKAGFELIVVTNQSGVARGLYSLEKVMNFNRHLSNAITAEAPEVRILDFMVCPHHPNGSVVEFAKECECRKPGIKLLLDAAARYSFNLAKCWLIGDKISDVDCAINAGIPGIQVISQVTAGGKQYEQHPKPYARAKNLDEAADLIISGTSSFQVEA